MSGEEDNIRWEFIDRARVASTKPPPSQLGSSISPGQREKQSDA